MWPHGANLPNGFFGLYAALNENQSGNQTSAAQATAAMNQNVLPSIDQAVNLGAGGFPSVFKTLVGYAHVRDWQVKPFHPEIVNLTLHVFDPKNMELMVFNQRHYGGCPPVRDVIEIHVHVSLPAPRCVSLARANRHANGSRSGTCPDFCYLERRGL